MSVMELPNECLSVGIGQWRIAKQPVGLRAILGSCLGVILYDRVHKIGGMAHILLPDSRGSTDHPGRYADTAIPCLMNDLLRSNSQSVKLSLAAWITGGAKMFDTQGIKPIGDQNHEAVINCLSKWKIPIVCRDIGGDYGRNVTFDTKTGRLFVKRPGGVLFEVQ